MFRQVIVLQMFRNQAFYVHNKTVPWISEVLPCSIVNCIFLVWLNRTRDLDIDCWIDHLVFRANSGGFANDR